MSVKGVPPGSRDGCDHERTAGKARQAQTHLLSDLIRRHGSRARRERSVHSCIKPQVASVLVLVINTLRAEKGLLI